MFFARMTQQWKWKTFNHKSFIQFYCNSLRRGRLFYKAKGELEKAEILNALILHKCIQSALSTADR
jgi:hypothetical protein